MAAHHRPAVLVALAALVFMAWELVDHVLLMDVEMVTYHLIGFIVETTLASLAIVWAAYSRERSRQVQQRAEALAAVVAEALGSDDHEVSPVARLVKSLDEMRSCAHKWPDVHEQIDRIERDARRIQIANRGLKEILWPQVGAAAR
jgi:cation transport regulator ChaC